MQAIRNVAIALLLAFTHSLWAEKPADFAQKTQQILEKHYHQFKDLEYFSGGALAILLPHQPIKNFYIGAVSHDPASEKISANTLFQIGSITKSFTSAIVLQLEKEKKIKLTDTLKTWLPQYDKWSKTNVQSLLNMTSGLPNYSETPVWNYKNYSDPAHIWMSAELINFAYPKATFSPPIKTGFFYTNTSYILASLIIAKIANHSFTHELNERIIKKASLANTFYSEAVYPNAVQARMAQGYGYNQYENPELLGNAIPIDNTSWAAAAGGVVASMEDVVKWVKVLFTEDTILDAGQRHKLMQLVSLDDGKPLAKTDSTKKQAFGLGVAEMFDKKMGRYWFYEGQTLGFRTLYMYIPCNGVIIASSFNSSTNHENDHIGPLMQQIYDWVLSSFPKLNCKS